MNRRFKKTASLWARSPVGTLFFSKTLGNFLKQQKSFGRRRSLAGAIIGDRAGRNT